MGAGHAFKAAEDRYNRQDFVAITYHLHIPQPDPMTNRSTLARQAFYGVRGVPSYYIDGEGSSGGGAAENAQSVFDRKVEPVVQKRLPVAPGARIDLRASASGQTIAVRASVSNVRSKSDKLRLQLALVEEEVRYSGENGVRFHSMVVRSLAGLPPAPPPAEKPAEPAASAPATPAAKEPVPTGFALRPGRGGTFEHTFDLAAIVADAKAHLEEFETVTRKGYNFREKKHEVNPASLSIVAFVQDEATKEILQAIYVKPAGAGMDD